MIDKNFIKSLIGRPSPVLFEIGCADGLDTLDFIKVFNDCAFSLYCFEPEPRNIEKFKKNILDSRVKLCEAAVGDSSVDNVPFYQSSTEYSSSLLTHTEALTKQWPIIEFNNVLNIKKVSLDDFVIDNKIDIIDFIWADVQGAEHLLIEGAKNTLKNKVRFFYTEYSNVAYYNGERNLEQILSILPDFQLIKDFGTDVLLKNKNMQ